LEKSNLLTPEELDQARKLLPADADAKTIGNLLIQKKLLTRWQAGQILAGRTALTLGKYRLLERLGKGGMGSVYLAEHRQMKRRAAIKTLPVDAHQDAAAESQLLAEAQAIAMLDHRNIVHAFDLEVEGDLHFLVMEYVEGEDLQQLVEREGPLPFDRAADYIAQAAEGLAHAHGRGLVHRDIKPANLLLERQGLIKISDFGLAHAGSQTAPASRPASQVNTALGTVDFLSPEQALDQDSVDQRSDIYSLGCTFYFLLTGLPPFPEGSLAERLVKHQTEEPRSILKLRPDAPHELVKACRKMMAKKPEQRFASAKEVATLLRAWRPEANDASQSVLEDSAVRPKGASDTSVSRSSTALNKAASPSASSIMRQVGTPTPRGGIPVARSLGDEPSVSGIRRSGAHPAITSQSGRANASKVGKRKKTGLYLLLGGLGLFVAIIVGMMVMVLNSSKPKLDVPPDAPQQASGKSPAAATSADRSSDRRSHEAGDESSKEPEKPKVAGRQGRGASATPATPPDHREPPQRTPQPQPAMTSPRPAAQANPFRELAKAVELPPVGRGDSESQVVTLGKVPVAPGGDYNVELLGGNIAMTKGGGQFRLRRQDVDAQNTDWLIAFDAATESTGATSSPVAVVRRRQNDLQFQWAAGAGKTPADQLRNCILHLHSGSAASMLRLRKPVEVPAVPVDLSKEKYNTTIPCEFLPDPESLFVEVLDLEARGVMSEVRPARLAVRSVTARESSSAEPTTIYLGDAKGDSTSKPLALRLSCVVRGLGSMRLEVAPMYRVNDVWTPLNTSKLTGTMNELKSKADSLSRRVEKLDADRYKKEFADAKKQLEDAEAAIGELEKLRAIYVKVNDVGRVHYRLIHRVGDQEVMLTTTRASDAN
jgi:serine/threonine protein kinase